jgi:hypothetical protein
MQSVEFATVAQAQSSFLQLLSRSILPPLTA